MFKSVKDQIWFFDCEWVPDPKAGRILYGLPAGTPDEDAVKEMWRRGGATPEDPQPFLKTNLCRVVSIAALMRRAVPPEQNDGIPVKHNLLWLPRDVDNAEARSEASVIGTFLGAVGRFKPQLVGFNSRASDLRILFQRAVVCGISAPEFCRRPDKPWEGVDYFAKDNDWCIDLMDSLGGWGGGKAPSLNEIAVLSGIPGKMDVCGDDVAGMWLSGRWKEIVQYNCFDALTTYLVWLRMAHLGGHLSDDAYEEEQMAFNNMLLEEAEKPGMDFLNKYIDEWNRLQEETQNG